MTTSLDKEINRGKSRLCLGIGSLFQYFGEGGLTMLLVGGIYFSIVLLE
jgi:hypothetical protein